MVVEGGARWKEEEKKARRPALVMLKEGAANFEILLPTREKEEDRENILPTLQNIYQYNDNCAVPRSKLHEFLFF